MKINKIILSGRMRNCVLTVLILTSWTLITAQTRIMPIGDSITWGKTASDPNADNEGYRKILHDQLTAEGFNVAFVGPSASSTGSEGFFKDKARISWFISDTAAAHGDDLPDISTVLAADNPDYVLLHIGTNDIGSGLPIGDYATPGTIINQLYTLVTRIVDYPSVDKLFLCKIIPKFSTPGEAAQTVSFNNAIEIMLDGFTETQRRKIQIPLVDMYTPFYANQTTYYGIDDNVHPNVTGYTRMADIFFQYLRREFIPSFTDEFNRAVGATIGNNWVSSAGMQIVDNGETPAGGALTFRGGGDQNWDNLAVWQDSENLTTVSMKFTSVTATNPSNAEGLTSLGLAVGMSAASATADGYLVWVYNNSLNVRTIVNGNAFPSGTNVSFGQVAFPPLQPGDVFKVSYRKASDANYFTVTVTRSGQEVGSATISDPNKRAGNGAQLYSGIMFKGYLTTPYEYYVDNFVVETQLDDNTAPDAPYNLSSGLVTKTTAYLGWTAPGNDGSIGTASAYDLRYSTSSIPDLSTDPTGFANATIVTGMPRPLASGTAQNVTVTGLVPGTRYYFRIQAIDSWGNKSRLSTQVTIRTSDAGFTVETFDRPAEPDGSIGPDWNIDPTEYTIQYNAGTGDGVFMNTQTGGWGRVAVYTGRTNPSIVKMVWGETTTTEGISMGGLALMLDNSSITNASGYLLFIRQNQWGPGPDQITRLIYLYNIRNGIVEGASGPIAQTAYTLKDQGNIRFPQRGDTMTVIMDWFDPQGTKFDVQINGQPASDGPLYDELRRHNSTVKYAGLMLGRLGGAANAVTSFYVSSELTSVGGIETLPYPSSAKVGTAMTDSLKILVRDGNNNPLPNTPVWFWVTTPLDASITAPAPLLDPIMIEAEWDLEPKGTYVIKNDKPSASGGKYAVAESGGPGAGELDYSFYVETAGDYWFWGRIIASGNGHYAVQIQVDDNSPMVWDTNYLNYSTLFAWSKIRNHQDPFQAIHLNAGVHTLKVTKLHDNVPIDKFYITTNGSYIPSGNEYRELLTTQSDGTSGTLLTLGMKSGPNKVRARAFGSDETVEFTVNGLADVPVTVEVQNQNQEGAARELLSKPFLLTLKDQNDNFTPDVIVKFELIQGDGTLTALRDTTDANGQALTYLQLGYGSAPNQVRATVLGSILEPVIFTGTAISGLAHTLESKVVKGTTKHYINQTYPNFLKGRVLNDQGLPMQDVPMTFVVTKGSATVGTRQPKMTNASGIASDTLNLGTQAGEVIVEARAAGFTTEIVVDSVYNYATRITLNGSATVAADVGGVSRQTVKVKVWNNHPITPAANVRVLFVAKENGFTFPNGNDSLVVDTDNDGKAETLVIPGPVHGHYVNVIEAQATDGFVPLTDSPIKFTIDNYSAASRLIRVSEDNLTGVVQEVFEQPIQVKMVGNPNSVPIVNQPVVFKIVSGGGSFIETEFPEFTDYTNSDGIAEVYYKLGKKTGTPENPYNNIITASATNGIVALEGSPITFHFSAQSSAATNMAADNNDTLFTGTVGKPLSNKVRVKVMDGNGNGVPGEEVIFSVIQGGGTLGSGSDTTLSVSSVNAMGIAEVSWTLGPKAGVKNNKLMARASNGTSTLIGSPLYFYGSGVADSVSVTQSTITAESPKESTGEDTSHVEVILLDKYGNPVPGKRILLSVTGGDKNYPYSPFDPTDANGKATGYLLSLTAGLKKVTASVVGEDKVLQKQAEVIFTSTEAAQIRSYTAGTLLANAGTVLRDSLAVLISDKNGNPVAYGPVKFTVESGEGQIIGSGNVVSDSNGVASVQFILGPNPGNNVVKASAKALDASDLLGSPVYFNVTGKQGEAISMLVPPKQVFEGAAGEVLNEPFSVGVIDEDGYAVANVPIIYELQQGGGWMETPQPTRTNAWGEAVAYFRADRQVGVINQILAKANLAGGPYLFEVTSVPGKADQIVHRSGDGRSSNVNGSIDVSVTVEDKYNNPVSGVTVTFQIVSGDAKFGGNASTILTTSNSEGVAQALVRLGATSGTVKVEASGRLLKGSPVSFTLYALSNEAANLKRYPASTADLIGTKGRELPAPLYVQVEDLLGNPVAGRNVVWALASGDGELLLPSLVMTDANGIASMRFKAGQGNESTVKATVSNKEALFTVKQVTNPNFPQLDMSLTPETASIFEGDLLNIPIRALPDGDGDALTFELGNLFPPGGVVIKKQSSTTAVLQWTPSYDQQGVYTLYFRVVDGQGGSDADSVRVTVYDTNRYPQIVQTIPSNPDTVFTNNQTVRFWVGAIDLDGDALHYTWKLDGINQGVDEAVFDLDVDKYYWGHRTLDVIVSDGKVAEGARFRWNIDVVTSVQFSEFVASFDPWQNKVVIDWATSHEVDNKGFEVLRSTVKDGTYQTVSDKLIPSQQSGKYEFEDTKIQVGAVYYYKLAGVDVRGNRSENDPIAIKIPKPDKFELTQNYPNPFNPTTTIRYNVPTKERVSITIYNMMGQRVATLVDREHDPGYYTISWDGKNTWGNEVSTGLYVYRLSSETKTLTKRMIKLK